jgi:hypothetical protein
VIADRPLDAPRHRFVPQVEVGGENRAQIISMLPWFCVVGGTITAAAILPSSAIS